MQQLNTQKNRRRRKRKRLPDAVIEASIETLSDEGRGIVHVDDRIVFVDQALAGETVRFQYTRYTKKLTEAKTVEVIEPSQHRVQPGCTAFKSCGGCSLQHMSHQSQIQLKQNSLIEKLDRIGKVKAQTVLSPLLGPVWKYRHKARLGVRYVVKKDKALVGFRERGSSYITDTQQCEVLHTSVGTIIVPLSELVTQLDAKRVIPQIEVAVGDNATLLVFRHLEPLSDGDRDLLIAFAKQHDVEILLQAGKPDQLEALWPRKQSTLYYEIDDLNDKAIAIEFVPSDFTQVNPELNRAMLARAIEYMQLESDDEVLDLFSGLGNFSLPMARRCKTVVAVEGSAAMVQKARHNAERNGIDNVTFVCADLYSDEINYAPWLQQSFNKVLLDPPRSGAAEMIPLIAKKKPQRIVYVSCQPATLARDAGMLVNDYGYKLQAAGIMDMFPHTAHVESIAIFER